MAQIQPTVTIGGMNATVQFAGLTAGFVGLYQVNAVVPSGVTVLVNARVGAGELHLFGRWSNGLKLDQHVTRVRTGPDLLRLDLAVSFGQIFVRGR